MNGRLKRLITFINSVFVAAVIAIIVVSIFSMLFEEHLIYFPSKYPDGNYSLLSRNPFIQDCWFTTEDGIKLHAWFAKKDTAIATLIISHGNAGNLSHRLEIIRILYQTGFNIFMYDYRGYGRSGGEPSEDGLYRDGRAAFDHAVTIPGVDPKRIILWGTSLGGAVAVDVAVHRSPAGLILESTFSSAKDVAARAYPFLPARLIMRTKFNSIEKIERIHVPILFMHGNKDTIIPIDLGKKIFNAANEPKAFYEIDGADHNDTYWVGGKRYIQHIREFALSCFSH